MIRSANPDCGRRPRPSATSHKPFGPSATKRFRQSRHVCRFTPSSSAIVKSLDPWCASNTMRQRLTTCWGVPCARTHVLSSSCCSGFSFKAIGLLLMRPLNLLEIDLSSYFSANSLASTTARTTECPDALPRMRYRKPRRQQLLRKLRRTTGHSLLAVRVSKFTERAFLRLLRQCAGYSRRRTEVCHRDVCRYCWIN